MAISLKTRRPPCSQIFLTYHMSYTIHKFLTLIYKSNEDSDYGSDNVPDDGFQSNNNASSTIQSILFNKIFVAMLEILENLRF